MILAILDDLMFTSKIRGAAGLAGVPLKFARSFDAALTELRATHPDLVIVDLDNPRTDPVGIISAMKADDALAAIPAIAFVSHVKADLIAAARQAGADDVLPRSAFVAQLPDILARAKVRAD